MATQNHGKRNSTTPLIDGSTSASGLLSYLHRRIRIWKIRSAAWRAAGAIAVRGPRMGSKKRLI